MPAYFKPLRRKIGIVTLLMACVFAAGWVHSHTYDDELNIPVLYTFYEVRSTTGNIWICRAHSTHSAANNSDHYPHVILSSGAEIIIAGTTKPARIHWQSMTHTRSKSSKLTLQLDDLNRDPEMKAWNIFGVKRFEKVRSFVENPRGGHLKTDELQRIIDELVIYVFPYWSIVIPLTLLSAWLLLSKPRVKPKPVRSTSP